MSSGDSCVLMFSGGRDSSLAALRLASRYPKLILATVASDHLVGLPRVERRLAELAPRLPTASWLLVRQPSLALSLRESRTCLPCQLGYALTAVTLSEQHGGANVAFGYTSYQATWPEQTPRATAYLRAALDELGIHLELPVYDLSSKEQAVAELSACGISTSALEQKCLRQVENVVLPANELDGHLDDWSRELRRVLGARDAVAIETVRVEALSARGRALSVG